MSDYCGKIFGEIFVTDIQEKTKSIECRPCMAAAVICRFLRSLRLGSEAASSSAAVGEGALAAEASASATSILAALVDRSTGSTCEEVAIIADGHLRW